MKPRRLLIPLILVVLFSVPANGQVSSEAGPATVRPIPWRMTSRGWQDASTWVRDMRSYDGPIERIHPSVLAANMVLGSMLALLWFSSEKEVGRFLRRHTESASDMGSSC